MDRLYLEKSVGVLLLVNEDDDRSAVGIFTKNLDKHYYECKMLKILCICSNHGSIYSSIYLSINLSPNLSINLSIYIYFYLTINQSFLYIFPGHYLLKNK